MIPWFGMLWDLELSPHRQETERLSCMAVAAAVATAVVVELSSEK